MSIKLKILLLIASIAVSFTLVLSLYSPKQSEELAKSVLLKDGEFIANLLAENLALGMQTKDLDDGAALTQALNIIKGDSTQKSELATIHNVRIFDVNQEFVMSAKGEKGVNKLTKKIKKLEFEEQDMDIFVSLPMKDQSGTELGYLVIELSKEYLLSSTAQSRNFTILMAIIILGGSMALGYYIVRSIVNNIKSVIVAADSVANGDLSVAIDIKSNDETKLLGNSISSTISTLSSLISEINTINDATAEGKLDRRGDASKFQGAYSEIVSGINNSMNSIIAPLNVAAEYIDRIAKGDIPPKITDKYQGDFNEIKNNLNQCIDSMNAMTSILKNTIDEQVAGDIDSRCNADLLQGTYRDLMNGVNQTLDAVLNPTTEAIGIMNQYANGDLSKEMRILPGKQIALTQGINTIRNNVLSLIRDANMLADASINGKLDVRADASKHQGDFRKIIEGFNGTLDAVIRPLNVAAEYIDRISKGDIPPKITDEYRGDFNSIKNNLNQCIDAIALLVQDASILSSAAISGDLTKRTNIEIHQGDFRKLVLEMNQLMNAIAEPIEETSRVLSGMSVNDYELVYKKEYKGIWQEIRKSTELAQGRVNSFIDVITNISNGDISDLEPLKGLGKRSDNDKLIPAGIRLMESIQGVINAMVNNTAQQKLGDIEAFADSKQFPGEYAKLIDGYNEGMSIHINSILLMLNLLNEYAEGNLSNEMPALPGKQIIATERVNKLRENVINLIKDSSMLSEAAVQGKLDIRPDASKHQGDFRKIIEGVNSTLDAIIHPLNIAAEYVDRIAKGDIPPKIVDEYKGDFNSIRNNLNQCIDAIQLLINDADKLAQAAVQGKLDVRANSSKHNGDFRKIIQGVNDTLDSVISPLNVAAEYVDRIAKGDIPPRIVDEYKGDFNEIKNNLNQCIVAIELLVKDSNYLSHAAVQGKLDTRADASKHQGDFRKIIEGVNNTLDAIIHPLNVSAEYMDRIAKGDIPPRIVDEYRGDFNEIKNNLNQCIDSINLLVSDANSLADAAILGDVKKRADIAKHNGDYRKIIQGFNNTLDAIIAPIDEAVNILELMAKGDLSQLMDGEFRGDHAVLKESLNGTIESINELLSQVSETVYQVLTGSSQVANTSQHLSSGAGEQAAAIEQMSSSMMEIASQTKQNAENAANANKLADNSLQSSERGFSEMQQLQVAMNDINESSKSIAKIIKVIDEIAFQTNLLALNAAVEAARAGVHGQGFAVVAEEVRNLARRSAEAAKETADLIEGSIKKVEVGNSLSGKTATVLNEIREQSVIVAGIIRQIAEASNEQATGINQIEIGFSQIDKITQQNTSGAEQSASAAEQLAGQAKMLEEMLSSFELINSGVSHAIAPPKSRKALKSHKYSLNS